MVAARILVVEDEPSTLAALKELFEGGGYEVCAMSDGAHALEHARRHGASLIVSDVNLPGLDGFSLCRRLRAEGDPTPIILLTSRDTEIDEALGLDLGADDYISKPFSSRVLLARVAALLRRSAGDAAPQRAERVVAGALTIDTAALELRWHDTLVRTTVTELRIVEALARRPGRVLSRAQLMALGRGDDSHVAPRIIDTYIARLRKKFEAISPGRDPIETVVGAGYRLRSAGT